MAGSRAKTRESIQRKGLATMQTITGKTFDEERALYGADGLMVKSCRFDGPADGESAFKEGRDVSVEDCFFNLRYPFWHDEGLIITGSEMTKLCRAALWYSESRHCGSAAMSECGAATLSLLNLAGRYGELKWRTAPSRANIS